MSNLLGKLSAITASVVAALSISSCAPADNANYLELDLQATGPRSSTYFDFGTGDYNLKVDNKGILIRQADGTMQPMIPVMGEIHFSRVKESDWEKEIIKMKNGGINVIATYVFWAHHEPANGKFDWSGNRNIRKFVELCGKNDLKVVLRIGPWCHGEVYLGGIPDWVVADQPIGLRSTEEKFMKYASRLYKEIGKQVKGLYGCTKAQPIIGVQIENERGGDAWPYFKALKNAALEAGIVPPFFTRTGWPVVNNAEFGEMLPLYGDYADGFWDRELTDMPGGYPDAFCFRESRLSNVIATEVFGTNQSRNMELKDLSYPYLTCELGGGMMTSYARRIHIFNHDAIALSVCKVGSGSNLPGYYMYHGGTNPYNPKHSMSEITESPFTNYNDLPYMTYDFQAPIGEMGQINDSYYELRRFHSFLNKWGGELSDYDAVFPATNTESGRKDSILRYTVRTDGVKGFVFVNNYQRLANLTDKENIRFKFNRTDGTTLIFPSEPITIADGTTCWLPFGLDCSGVTLDYATAMPYNKVDEYGVPTYVLASIEGIPVELCINGEVHKMETNTTLEVNNSNGEVVRFKVLNDEVSLAPVQEYTLEEVDKASATATLVQETKGLRETKMHEVGVISQPRNEDYAAAAVWNIALDGVKNAETAVLEVNYKGDVARLYADGQLVEDNFWNGRPMLVRIKDIIGKKVELRILPLGKQYQIYLQPEQKKVLEAAAGDYMLSLDSLRVLDFKTRGRMFREDIPTAEIWLSDPAVLADPATQMYYMTGSGGMQYRSKDLMTWSGPYNVIEPDTTSWMGPRPAVWAAEPYLIEGKYYYFGTFTNNRTIIAENEHGKIPRRSCHILVSDKAAGPFRPIGDELYVNPNVPTLDATYLGDTDGKKWLLYCEEWLINSNGTVEAIQLKDDLSGVVGERIVLFRAFDAPWNIEKDGKHNWVTDGPFAFRTETGKLGVFWTSWQDGVYTTGAAYSTSGTMEGPWVQDPEPIIPGDYGHAMLFKDLSGKWMMSVHSNKNLPGEGDRKERHPNFFDVDLSGDKLVVKY